MKSEEGGSTGPWGVCGILQSQRQGRDPVKAMWEGRRTGCSESWGEFWKESGKGLPVYVLVAAASGAPGPGAGRIRSRVFCQLLGQDP